MTPRAGGYGDLGVYTTTVLGSDDVTNLVIQHQTDENAAIDFGHGDIWFANQVEIEVWEPLTDWIEAH